MTKNKPCTLYNVQTDWSYFQELLKTTTLDNSILLKTEDNTTNAVERFNQTVQQVAWSAMPTSSNSEIHRILTGNQRKNSREKEAPQTVVD